MRGNPAFFPALVDDGAFDSLDGDRIVPDVERAARLAGRRADAPGELREVVGRMQILQCLQPLTAIDEVVPVGNLVVDRAAIVAIGDAAIHAAGRLVAGRLVAQRDDEFAAVPDAVGGRLVAAVAALDFEKTCDLAHGYYSAAI